MTVPVIIVLSVLLIAFIVFVTGWLRPDLTAIMVLLVLVLTGVISPQDSFQGFSSFAVMAIAGLLVIGEGLERTGVVRWVARQLEKLTGKSFNRLLLINSATPGLLSGFVNIVAAASFFIPVILRLCLKMKVSPSRVLMPMASIALIGANLTLIGASHNLVVHSLLEEYEGAGFGFFEFTVVGASLLIMGLLYVFFAGRYLLPDKQDLDKPKKVTVTANLIRDYHLKDQLFEAWITSEFEEEDLRIQDIDLERKYGLNLLEVVREGTTFLDIKEFIVESGDMLLLHGDEREVQKFCDSWEGITFMGPPRSQKKISGEFR